MCGLQEDSPFHRSRDSINETLCTQDSPCAEGIRLPASESTVYTEGCWSAETLLSGQHGPAAPWHVVGIGAQVQESSEAIMHHFLVYGFPDNDNCGRIETADVLWAWAPGSDALKLPSEAGFPILHANSTDGAGYSSFMVQVHHLNPAHPHTLSISSRTLGALSPPAKY